MIEPGEYQGVCTEFCGLSHAYMRKFVVAMAPADYEAWVAGQLQGQTPLAEGDTNYAGEQTFITKCSSCHVVVGVTSRPGSDQVDGWELYTDDPETEYTVAQYIDRELVLKSGAAPNLTHFASRDHYAGATLELRDDDGNIDRAQLEAWLRNPPAEKPANAGNLRGMPNLGLSETEIDNLVDYLLSLD